MADLDAKKIIEKYKAGEPLTDEETSILESWYLDWKVDDELNLSEAELAEELQLIRAGIPYIEKKPKVVRLWPKVAVAASLLFILSFGAYFLFDKHDPSHLVAQNHGPDIAPGSDKATITLSNGKQIAVSGAKNGLLASQGNTSITVNGNNVVYKNNGDAGKLVYNTLTTPRGGQYPLVLADGTHVWLDAASSITYPVAFVGNNREVSITGQVYFEVAHDASKPFRVTANGQTVQVLGTHFNINAYADEPVVKTTLFEGSIKLSTIGGQAILKPGEQAQVNKIELKVTGNVDMDEAIAWHKGLFQFKNADVPTVMRQLSRWYDEDIAYDGEVPKATFSGKIYRNLTALKVEDILSYEKIHFRIEGKKIIVMP